MSAGHDDVRAARVRQLGDGTRLPRSCSCRGGRCCSPSGSLAAVHVDDRYGVGAAAACGWGSARPSATACSTPPSTRTASTAGRATCPCRSSSRPAPRPISNELLVSAKLLIYAVAGGLYTLLYWSRAAAARPWPIALGLVGAVLATAAGLMTALGIRWDALATLLQLARSRSSSTTRGLSAARRSPVCCALALAAKISALWAPVALVVWLAVVARRSLGVFLASFVGSCVALAVLFETLSSGGSPRT